MDKNTQVTIQLNSREVKRLNKLRKQIEASSSDDRNLVFNVTVSNTTGIGENVYVEAYKVAINHPDEQVLQRTDITDYESW